MPRPDSRRGAQRRQHALEVHAGRCLGTVGVACEDRVDDFEVFGARDFARPGVKPSRNWCRADCACRRSRISAVVRWRLMRWTARSSSLLSELYVSRSPSSSADVMSWRRAVSSCGVVVRQSFGGLARRDRLERDPRLRDLDGLVDGDRAHARAAVREAFDESLAREREQRRARRRARDAESLAEIRFDEALLRGELSRKDRVAHQPCDVRRGRRCDF